MEGQEEKKDKGEVSSSSSKKKKRDKKVKKKEKKKDKEKSSGLGGRANAVKPLADLYGGTGMDPRPEKRRSLRRRVKRKLKKEKETSSSSGSSSTSEGGGPMELSLLEQRSKIQRIAELAPGLLSSEALTLMKDHLLQASGTPWGVDDASLPPLVMQYVRQHCIPKASPPVARELSTLALVCDHLLMGRAAEGLDTAFQRVR